MTEQQQELYEKLLKKVNEYCLGAAAEDVIAAIDALVESYEPSSALEYLQRRYTLEKQSSPLQALENIIETFVDKDSEDIKTVRNALQSLDFYERHCGDLEKLLVKVNTEKEKYRKALEILKRKKVDMALLLWCFEKGNCLFYNQNQVRDNKMLEDEEYNFLKEMLK